MQDWQGHPHRAVVAGETHPNDPHAAYGLLKLSGPMHRQREIIARFRTKPAADAACAQHNADNLDPNWQRYEVIGLT